MPVKKFSKGAPDTATRDLTEKLAHEWTHPNSGKSEPVILLEDTGASGILHVYVVWDAWEPLTQIERSEIIMDAAEEVLSPDEIMNITVAMGLTFVEADAMGIAYR